MILFFEESNRPWLNFFQFVKSSVFPMVIIPGTGFTTLLFLYSFVSRKLLPMGNVIFNVRRKSKNQTLWLFLFLMLRFLIGLSWFIILNHLFFRCQLPRVDVLLRKVICLSTFVLTQNPTLRLYTQHYVYIYIKLNKKLFILVFI